ncbi:MAG: alpha-2-macroglobulin family protein [Pseudomonadota bacterium]
MRALFRFCSLLVLSCVSLFAHAQTTVSAFTPTGTVKNVRQVTARFSAPMVPFGDLRLGDPFDIDCQAKGSGRWIDSSNWSYDFDADLPAGLACGFTLKPGLKAMDGLALAGKSHFAFATGGPAIVEAMPRDGAWNIDENQVFILGLDAPAREASITANAYCSAEGINERIGVRILAGKERDGYLALRKNFVDRYLSVFYQARGALWGAKIDVKTRRRDTTPIVVLQCQRTLPSEAKVTLVWGQGIATASGIGTTEEQSLAFRSRPDFKATFSCQRTNSKAPCIPFLPMQLNFSSPIRASDARAITLTGADGKVYHTTVDKEEAKSAYVANLSVNGPFPEKSSFTLALPPGLKDDAGRTLVNAARFPLAVGTDEQPPLVKFPSGFGILEARGDKLLPVTMRNVEGGPADAVQGAMLRVPDEQVMAWMQRLSHGESMRVGEQWGDDLAVSVFANEATEKFTLPKPGGAAAFEVIGIPLRKPGFYVVELASPKLGAVINRTGTRAYVRTAALVTNLAAHFKRGASSSLVWVTSLDKGKPVARAQVTLQDCKGKQLWKGSTDANGIANIRQELTGPRCSYSEYFVVTARSGDDMTFTVSNWDQGIESWRFNLPTGDAHQDNTMLSTVFDRTLLRTGETVHMKHFLRKHTASGIDFTNARLGKANIVHQGSDQKYPITLVWKGGSAETDWVVPDDAKQGSYEVVIGEHSSGTFRVEQFRVPTMKATVQGPKETPVAPAALALDLQVSYLSGGGASFAPVKVRTMVQAKSISFPDYDEFSFSPGDVAVGVVKDNATFDEDEGSFNEGAEGQAGAVNTRAVTLDGAGGAKVVIDQLPKSATPQELMAEVNYQDANGETLAVSTRVPLWPSRFVVGIKPDGWVLSKEALKFQVIVLDVHGKPVAGAPVAVDYFQRLTYSHRRRLMGGFYAYENSSEVKRLGPACEGTTNDRGLLLCDGKAPADGNLILRARTQDAEQHAATATHDVWVAGSANWWFRVTDNDRIDLLPSKKRYEPGETASFQVRSPFREATALVTVEREGIIDTFVRPLSGTAPVFTIPIKGSYGPNVFVSALVVRGRVASTQPTALVDLGKPAYKLGIAQVRVGWAAHELKVQVDADKAVYKVREKAAVKVRVARADGSPLPAGSEIALAAVDVGLLELMPNTSWDLLEAMMQQRNLQVQTSTAQMQVIGKRHFGRKAFPAGGGGGKGAGRELFDTLLFWKARVTLDANGEASVQVPLNDSLTAFRIVAIASSRADLFGTGRTDIRTSQDLMLLSGLPALVREGDQFRAGFTLRNTTDAELTVNLEAKVTPDGGTASALPRQAIVIGAGQSQDVGWDFKVPLGAKTLAWEVRAQQDGAAGDKMTVKQTVKPVVPVRTYQATLLQLDKPQSMPVRAPADALPERGGVLTTLLARLGSDLPGVKEYMSAYPYTCFEQKTSRSIALHDEALWRATMASLPAHLDEDGLVKYFPLMMYGSDSLTAYVLSVANEAGYDIPDELKTKMEEGLLGFVNGRVVRHSALRSADVAVRKIAALEALSRSGKVKQELTESFNITPNLWPTSAVIDWYLVLERTAGLNQRDAQMAQVQQILRARLNLQGTTMGFSTERTDDWWWLMSSADTNANRLLLAMLDNPQWQSDMGRLARGTLGRQRKGRWGTTVANAWGTLAIEKFSAKFESAPVTGSTDVRLGRNGKGVNWSGEGPHGTILHPWPAGEAQLTLKHNGGGKPWAIVSSLAAIPLKAPLSSGFKVVKTITPIDQKVPGAWSRGDVYRVHLDLEAQSDMTWVVVDDPIPASAGILGTGLGRDSQILTTGEKRAGWVWPAFEERTFEAFRSYFEFVPKGKWSVEYTVRLNNDGLFALPATRVEAMYSPEMFGEAPNGMVKVGGK